jgi:hypothetical protein
MVENSKDLKATPDIGFDFFGAHVAIGRGLNCCSSIYQSPLLSKVFEKFEAYLSVLEIVSTAFFRLTRARGRSDVLR